MAHPVHVLALCNKEPLLVIQSCRQDKLMCTGYGVFSLQVGIGKVFLKQADPNLKNKANLILK